jgi:protein O-GlcNAc transferase
MPTLSEALAIAAQHHQAGELEIAEQIYRQILAVEPNQAEVVHLLGIIASQVGKYDDAIQWFSRAIELKPGDVELCKNLGSIFRAQGRLEDAVTAYRRAEALKPDDGEACCQLGNIHQAQGNLAQAVDCYRRALRSSTGDAVLYNNLGNALQSQGNVTEAIDAYRRALELRPDFAEGYNNLANAFHDQRNLGEAVYLYRRALELKPEFIDAQVNLGNALHALGDLVNAAECYQRALELDPKLPRVHNDLGNVLWVQGRSQEAFNCYRRAAELDPGFADAHINLGTAFQTQGQLEAAIACFQRVLELDPNSSLAHNNLGNALRQRGMIAEAITSYRRAIEISPNYADAHNNLGNVLLDYSRFDEAVASYGRAIELRPDFADAYKNLGPALQGQGRCDEAVESCRRATELRPNDAGAFVNLAHALKDQGRIDEAICCFRRALEVDPWNYVAHSGLVFTLWYSRSYGMDEICQEHKKWCAKWAEPLANQITVHANDRTPSRRLRIGYVSSAFRNHAAALFALPLFRSHNHEHFEIVCYSDVGNPDSFTSQHRACADLWRNIVGLTDVEVAQAVRQDQIDILVDLTMHMEQGRLLVFARKPAPVQVCWLAYPGTTGLTTMDYRLTDPYLDPPGLHDRYYSEESVRLPDCFWCYDPMTDLPTVSTLPAAKNGYITFGCLNNFCKVDAVVLELWARVLRAVERSRLVLLAPEGSARENVLQVLFAAGISADRVTFVARQAKQQYLQLYQQIDIGLDTVPSNGHTTSLDSFWMGIPVVTLVGDTVSGRAGLCQLNNLNLTELIANSPDRFVSIAVELCHGMKRLAELRASLRQRLQESPLMDAPRFAANVEAAYRWMWQRWCSA